MTPAELAEIRAASDVLSQAWALEFPDRLLSTTARVWLLAIARGENRFGASPGFVGSNNWGSLRCFRHDFGCIQAGDRDADGNPVVASFQKFPNAVEGARAFVHTLLRREHAVPIDGFDPIGIARAMYSNGYFTGVAGSSEDRIFAYARLIRSNGDAVCAALGVSYVARGSVLAAVTMVLAWLAWRLRGRS